MDGLKLRTLLVALRRPFQFETCFGVLRLQGPQADPEELRVEIQSMVDGDVSKQLASKLREQISKLANRQAAFDLHVDMGRLLAAK